MTGVKAWKEMRLYGADPSLKDELLLVPNIPRWVKKIEIKSPPDYFSEKRRAGYYDLT